MKDLNLIDESFELDGFSNIVNYPSEDVHNEVFSNMINYPSEDVHNEVFSNMINYPSEDVHNEVFSNMINDSRGSSDISKQINFEIFSGQDGSEQESDEAVKRQQNTQRVSDTLTAVGGAVGSVVSAVQSFQDPSKKSGKEFKKQLKAVCGRRPVLKKKRGTYDACVKEFMQRNYSPSTRSNTTPTPQFEEPKNNKVILYVGIGVAVLVAGFIVYKVKFAKK
jgi:hypothetical protein